MKVQIIATKIEVDEEIANLANQILSDYPDTSPLFVALLRGAAPFASKLMFAITEQHPEYHPDLDYMMVSAYGSGRKAGTPRVVTDLAPDSDLRGRAVIVLDDVLDKGVTAEFVINHLHNRGATDIKLAVLVDKKVERQYPIQADYVCFDANDAWLSGMGMDDASIAHEAYRWSSQIWVNT